MNNTEYGKLLSLVESAPDVERIARAQARILLELSWDVSRLATALEAILKPKPES